MASLDAPAAPADAAKKSPSKRLSMRFGTPRGQKKEAKQLSIGVAWPGARHQITVTTKTTVLEVKQEVMKLANIPVGEQQLSYKNKVLKKDKKALGKYKVEDDRTIVLVRLGKDGKPPPSAASAAAPRGVDISTLKKAAPVPKLKPVSTTTTTTTDTTNGATATELAPPPAAADSLLSPTVEMHKGVTMEVSNKAYLEKEENDDLVKFVVQHGKKDHKMKMPQNTDVWAILVQLEQLGLGKAGHMTLTTEEGEELDEEEMLDEADITNGTKLTLEIVD